MTLTWPKLVDIFCYIGCATATVTRFSVSLKKLISLILVIRLHVYLKNLKTDNQIKIIGPDNPDNQIRYWRLAVTVSNLTGNFFFIWGCKTFRVFQQLTRAQLAKEEEATPNTPTENMTSLATDQLTKTSFWRHNNINCIDWILVYVDTSLKFHLWTRRKLSISRICWFRLLLIDSRHLILIWVLISLHWNVRMKSWSHA